MSIVKVEVLSNKILKIGEKLKGVFIEDKMYYDTLPKHEKYIVRLFDRESNPCGFVSRESLFSKNTPKDIIQAMFDLDIEFNHSLEFEVLDVKDINRNKKQLYILKLLDFNIASKILGLSPSKKTEISAQKYLDKYNAFNSVGVDNDTSDTDSKDIVLSVKGDAKKNPKRTLVTRLIKSLEMPQISIVLDDNSNYRVVYENEYAGDILNVPDDLELKNIIEVACHSTIPLGYNISIKYHSNIQDSLSKVEEPLIESIEPKVDCVPNSKRMKADKEELLNIIEYLNNLSIPEELIDRVISSHEPFEEKYLKRIPSSKDKDFTPWVMSPGERNLLLLAIIQIEEGINLRLVGSKGTGKNTFLKTLSWIYQRPEFTQSGSLDIDIDTLIGDKNLEHKVINDNVVQSVGFETGLLIEAMEVGGFFELGEGNSCRPGVLMSLHTVLDGRKFMDVKGYKLVQAHPRFSFVLTMNVDYEGCNDLNQGFRDRFSTIKFLPPKDITTVLKNTCPFATEENINICNRVYKNILHLSSELQSEEVVTVRGYIRTLQMSKYISIGEALKCCITDNVSDDYLISTRINQIIENIVG